VVTYNVAKIEEQECEKWQQMTEKLETVLEKVPTYQSYQSFANRNFASSGLNNCIQKVDYTLYNLKTLVLSATNLILPSISYDNQEKEKILEFLNKRIEPKSNDPDEKWIYPATK
jgi:hypothetical protein